MGMFTRFTDIINANINSMLDKAEHPEKMIKLIVAALMVVSFSANATKVVFVDYAFQADKKVFFTTHAFQADKKILFVDHGFQADDCKILSVDYAYQADQKWYKVGHAFQADLKVHEVDYGFQVSSGCK